MKRITTLLAALATVFGMTSSGPIFKKRLFIILSILGILILGTLGLSQNALAAQIPIFSTGVDDSGNPLPLGSVDPHFVVVETGNQAVVLDPIAGVWVDNDTTSQWIWLTSDMYQNTGTTNNPIIWTFRTTFDLTGFDPSTAQIDGLFAVDNGLDDIKLNGNSLPNSSGGFTSRTAFSITSGFQPGINTLEFIARDWGVVAGFNVKLSGTVEIGNSPPIANAGPDQVTDTPDSKVFLNGSLSSDSDGDPLTYSWTVLSQPDGGNANQIAGGGTSELAEYTVEKEGDYIFQLIVNDGREDSDPDTVTVTVAADLILVSAEPIQAVEGVSAFVLDKPTVFKAVIQNTSPEDKTFFVTLWLDNTALVSVDEILVKANCKATYYFPNPKDPTACDDKPLPAFVKSYIPKSSVIGEGLCNFTTIIDSGNGVEEIDESNNELVSEHRWTKTKDLVVLYVPIKPVWWMMNTPCPPETREAGVFCSPNPARIVTPIQWMNLIYPIDNIQYIPLPPIYNFFPRGGDYMTNIPLLWNVLDSMRNDWINSNPGANREVVLYGWLPTDTIKQAWGSAGKKLGFGDENVLSIGNCANCGDMHINDMILAHEVGHMLSLPHPTDEKRVPPCDDTSFNAPFTSIKINKQGYHILTGNVKDPAIHEYMMGGHCTTLGIKADEEKWTSPEGWDNIIQLFGVAGGGAAAAPLVAQSENTIIVSGTIFIDGNSGQLDPLYSSMLPADVTDGPFTLEILDSYNNVIYTQNFATYQPDHFDAGGDAVNLSFFFVSPFLLALKQFRY